MDRRVVVGLVGIALAGVAEDCRAQAASGRDPSAQPSVGLAPIPSIGDSINNTTVFSPVVPMASSVVPANPVGVGPAAPLPRTPVPPNPVSMTPIEPIQRSINRGFGTGAISSMFRKPAERPAATVLRSPPRVEPVARLKFSTVPSLLSDSSTATAPPGRPAPFANRSPEAPRAQAAPPATSSASADQEAGRAAPFAEERPRTSRPKAAPANTPVYRPAETPAPAPEPVKPAPEPVIPVAVPLERSAPAPSPAPDPVVPAPAVLEGPSPIPVSAPDPVVPAPLSPESSSPPALPALPPLPGDGPPAAMNPPLGTDPLAGLDPVPAASPPVAATAAVEVLPVPSPSPAPASAPSAAPGVVDPNVSRTGLDEIAVRTGPVRPRPLPYAAYRAAAVGDEIITFNELDAAITEQLRHMGGGQPIPSGEEGRQLKNQVAATILNRMIDEALVIQEAKKKMLKKPEAKKMFDEFADKEWNSQELPPLLRNTASANVHELKVKLAAEGKSYGSMKETFRKKLMFQSFLNLEIHNKMNADMIEMRLFYDKNLDKFEQPARMTWREVEINMSRYPSRAAARQKAEEVLARLLRDEDFDAVARSVSNGPTASKGGLYVDMQPGSYGIPVVNDELNRIPTGQVSKILEAPGSFHIIRVDSRREKGPLRFDEVQDKIRGMVLEQNHRKAVDEYLAKLRAKTLIRTMFDNTESDPELARRNDPAVRQASGFR
jgi:hypothetical protein